MAGRKAEVVEPAWFGGMVKVCMKTGDAIGSVKSYHRYHLHIGSIAVDGYQPGDLVQVVKEGTFKGWSATVIDPNWNGRVKVKMSSHSAIAEEKSYLLHELEYVSNHVPG